VLSFLFQNPYYFNVLYFFRTNPVREICTVQPQIKESNPSLDDLEQVNSGFREFTLSVSIDETTSIPSSALASPHALTFNGHLAAPKNAAAATVTASLSGGAIAANSGGAIAASLSETVPASLSGTLSETIPANLSGTTNSKSSNGLIKHKDIVLTNGHVIESSAHENNNCNSPV
jgi:hypothetical protein